MRNLTRSERNELEAIVSPTALLLRWAIFGILVTLSGLFSRVFNELTKPIVDFSWWPAVPPVCGIFLVRKFKAWSGGKELRRAVREDLAEGKVEEREYMIQRGIVYPENEDEGDSYFLEDETGKVVYFGGQELPRRFPKRNVVVAIAPKSRRILSITAFGEAISGREIRKNIETVEGTMRELRDTIYCETSLSFDEFLKAGGE